MTDLAPALLDDLRTLIDGSRQRTAAAINSELVLLYWKVGHDRFGTDFDAQDLIDGVTEQLTADEKVQQAVGANDRANFDFVGGPAFEGALIDRRAKHGVFIDRVFGDDELLAFLKKKVLDGVYAKLTATDA